MYMIVVNVHDTMMVYDLKNIVVHNYYMISFVVDSKLNYHMIISLKSYLIWNEMICLPHKSTSHFVIPDSI